MIIHTTLGTLNPIQSCHQCTHGRARKLCLRSGEAGGEVERSAEQSSAEERRDEEPIGIDSSARATSPLALEAALARPTRAAGCACGTKHTAVSVCRQVRGQHTWFEVMKAPLRVEKSTTVATPASGIQAQIHSQSLPRTSDRGETIQMRMSKAT